MVRKIENRGFSVYGCSDCLYEFEIYLFDGDFSELAAAVEECGGVYIFTERTVTGGNEPQHTLIYCGSTDSVTSLLKHHRKADAIMAAGANCFCFYPEPAEFIRVEAEADILGGNEFVCYDGI